MLSKCHSKYFYCESCGERKKKLDKLSITGGENTIFFCGNNFWKICVQLTRAYCVQSWIAALTMFVARCVSDRERTCNIRDRLTDIWTATGNGWQEWNGNTAISTAALVKFGDQCSTILVDVYKNVRHTDIRHISVTIKAHSSHDGNVSGQQPNHRIQWTNLNWTNVHLFRLKWCENALHQMPLRRPSHSIWNWI